jgi:DHA1 family inner membrane transport protein
MRVYPRIAACPLPPGPSSWSSGLNASPATAAVVDPAPVSSSSSPVHFGRAVAALGVGGFAIGTGEFVIMGLLPEVARDIGVSIPQAGHVISAYALGVVIGAPVLAVLAAGWHRRALLIALMAVFAAGNFACALAPGYLSLNLLRFVAGLPHGTYFGVAALVAATLAPPGRRARAVGLVMLGLTGATLVGVPIAAWLGQWFGWRAAFVFVGAIALAAIALLRRDIPDIAPAAGASPWRELGALKRKQVWLTLGIAAIGFGGMFSVFSYVKPTLTEVAGLPIGGVPFVLALFGLGMVAGNLVGARLADKSLMRTIGGLLAYAAVVLVAFSFTAHHVVTAAINVFLIGTTVAIGPALQIRLMDVAGDAQTLAAALNHSAFNMANALGAWLGGLAITAGLGWTSTGWVGALLAVGGLGVFAWSLASMRADARALDFNSRVSPAAESNARPTPAPGAGTGAGSC